MNRQGYEDNSYPWLDYKDPSSAGRDIVSPNNKRLGKFLGIRYGENKPRIEEVMLLKSVIY